MPVTIPDDILEEAGLTEQEARLEVACRLYDAEKLTLFSAARLAGLSRGRFEDELRARKIPIYRPTVEDLRKDLATLDRMGI
jgi:predicted HTH domain antitoxin